MNFYFISNKNKTKTDGKISLIKKTHSQSVVSVICITDLFPFFLFKTFPNEKTDQHIDAPPSPNCLKLSRHFSFQPFFCFRLLFLFCFHSNASRVVLFCKRKQLIKHHVLGDTEMVQTAPTQPHFLTDLLKAAGQYGKNPNFRNSQSSAHCLLCGTVKGAQCTDVSSSSSESNCLVELDSG